MVGHQPNRVHECLVLDQQHLNVITQVVADNHFIFYQLHYRISAFFIIVRVAKHFCVLNLLGDAGYMSDVVSDKGVLFDIEPLVV